jgi:hypothetical protein
MTARHNGSAECRNGLPIFRYICAWLFLCCTFASMAAEPVDGYIKDIQRSLKQDLWWTDRDGEPKGGYILRCELDTGNAETSCILLASSVEYSRADGQWTIYNCDHHGCKRLGEVCMNPAELYRKPNTQSPTYIAYCGDRDYLQQTTFTLVRGKLQIASKVLGDSRRVVQELRETFTNPNPPVHVQIYKTLLGTVVRDNRENWRPVDDNYVLYQQYLDSRDTTEITSLKNWNPPGDQSAP